ncbi:hypothetical protein PLICRDRAFT_526616 [Plicaturopsis crispa FD-325 SS-3]|nr:hypothetical protein PLICRDRAFT_526616 [Plicaturopsis crispa FD-325 SS-3]
MCTVVVRVYQTLGIAHWAKPVTNWSCSGAQGVGGPSRRSPTCDSGKRQPQNADWQVLMPPQRTAGKRKGTWPKSWEIDRGDGLNSRGTCLFHDDNNRGMIATECVSTSSTCEKYKHRLVRCRTGFSLNSARMVGSSTARKIMSTGVISQRVAGY